MTGLTRRKRLTNKVKLIIKFFFFRNSFNVEAADYDDVIVVYNTTKINFLFFYFRASPLPFPPPERYFYTISIV